MKKNWNVIRQKSIWILWIKIKPNVKKVSDLIDEVSFFQKHFHREAGREIWSKESREDQLENLKQ